MIAHPRRSSRKVAANAVATHDHDADWAAYVEAVRQNFEAHTDNQAHLFMTDAEGLWEAWLNALPAEKQVHTCTSCHRFVKYFGGIVAISEDGATDPVMWGAAPDFYRHATLAVAKAVKRARVTAPYISAEHTWGIPHTGQWTHLAVDAMKFAAHRNKLLTPNQAMAAKREDFRTVASALADFTEPMLTEALRLLEAEALNRSEKFVGPVRWLIDLQTKRGALKGLARDNVLWRAIAAAPDGYCHPRASVVGSLLEDIAAGKPFEDIRRAFAAKTHGLAYQRPQAAPSAGNIAAAEKIVEQLGIARSLERRFARVDELETFWTPREVKETPSAGGVFGHLAPKGETPAPLVDLPTATMTWVKFVASVLPNAERIELMVPHGNEAFSAFTAAMHEDAPPVLKWDREGARNHIAQYCYHNGSPASSWGLRAGSWCPVSAVSTRANLWGDNPLPHLGEGVMLVLLGAMDTRTRQGNALFPETLQDHLHQIRSTVEAYSQKAELGGRDEGSACGLMFGKGQINTTLRAMSAGRWATYLIDRWD